MTLPCEKGCRPVTHSYATIPKQKMSLALVVGILLSAFQQLVGINAVLYYGPQMFENMGFKGDASFAQTVIMGVVMVVLAANTRMSASLTSNHLLWRRPAGAEGGPKWPALRLSLRRRLGARTSR